jgi:hypothetical protein
MEIKHLKGKILTNIKINENEDEIIFTVNEKEKYRI